MSKRLLVDMDGVLARFHDEVSYLERMYEEGFFAGLKPFENMVNGIKLFIQWYPDVEVKTCSAGVDSPFCVPEKDAWLDLYLPEIPKENRIYTAMGRSKAEYLEGGVTKDDFLLDDYNKGLHMFMHDGGSAIKCHNNINQKGLGAHGGEKGFMWEGPMIHANDCPELIASEIAQLMGLEHHIEKVTQANDVQLMTVQGMTEAAECDFEHELNLIEIPSPLKEPRYIAGRQVDIQDSSFSFFSNPYNALRYLSDDKDAREFSLRTSDGQNLTFSGYQLQAVCQNTYGSPDYLRFLAADKTHLADSARDALRRREKAVVGVIYLEGSTVRDSERKVCHSHEEMLNLISQYEAAGRTHEDLWLVPPPENAPDHIKPHDKAALSSFDSLLNNARQRAGTTPAGKSDQPEH